MLVLPLLTIFLMQFMNNKSKLGSILNNSVRSDMQPSYLEPIDEKLTLISSNIASMIDRNKNSKVLTIGQ